jgi:hypothetical protein
MRCGSHYNTKAPFGLMEYNEMERSGIEWSWMVWSRMKYFIPLFGYFMKEKNKIKGMWWYEMKFIPFYFIPLRSIPLFFFKSKQWNIILFHSTQFRYILSIQTEPKSRDWWERGIHICISRHINVIKVYKCIQWRNQKNYSGWAKK